MSEEERRSHPRVPVSINTVFTCDGRIFSGTIRNVSHKGMLICMADYCYPLQSEFEISLPIHHDSLQLPAKLLRIEMLPDSSHVGVILLDPPLKYIEFIESLSQS